MIKSMSMSSEGGFLLLEAVMGLALLMLASSLLFAYQSYTVHQYHTIREQIQALYIACSILEQCKLRQAPVYPQAVWQAHILKQMDPLLPLVYLSVSLCKKCSHKKDKRPCKGRQTVPTEKPLVTLKTAYIL